MEGDHVDAIGIGVDGDIERARSHRNGGHDGVGLGDACDDDDDDDGFTDSIEAYLGTDPLAACPLIVGSHDAWPLDMNMDKLVTVIPDILAYRGNVNQSVADDQSRRRLDLNMDNFITVIPDVFFYRGKIGQTCT